MQMQVSCGRLVPCHATAWRQSSRAASGSGGQAAAVVVRLTPASNPELTSRAVRTLGEAFVEDTTHTFCCTRPGSEPAVFEGLARLCLDKYSGQPVLYATEGDAAAAAIVLDKQQSAQLLDPDWRLLRGALQILSAMPLAGAASMATALDALDAAGAQVLADAGVAGDCLKLIMLATRPAQRRRGLGTAVLASVLADADARRLPVYLENTSAAMEPLYQQFGFETRRVFDLMPLQPAAGKVGGAARRGETEMRLMLRPARQR